MTRWIPLLVGFALMAASSCERPSLPHVQEPATVRDPWHVAKKILITADVDDDVVICAELPDPNQHGPVCFLTVGELRAGYDTQRRAD